jgi:tetratricopeptide (TPR) repeat protein
VKTAALALLLLLASSLTAPARAQTAEAPDDEAAATALVDQAAHAYDQNQFDEALQLLGRAYALSPRPSILYNQAQVLRAKDDCAGALDAYRRFIETTTPDDPNRERALRRRDEMQACADKRSPPPAPVRLGLDEAPRPAAAPPAAVVSLPAAPEEKHPGSHRRALRLGGWAAVGVGVVAATAAAILAWEAHSIQDDVNSDIAKGLGWPSVQPRYDEGQNDASRARWCAGIAAVAGAGGATMLILSRPPAGSGATATAEPRATFIGWSGTF